jgi:hypothetical protein
MSCRRISKTTLKLLAVSHRFCRYSFCIVSLCLRLAKRGEFVRSLWRSLTGRTGLSALTDLIPAHDESTALWGGMNSEVATQSSVPTLQPAYRVSRLIAIT